MNKIIKFVIKFGNTLFYALLAVSIIPILLIDSEFNASYNWAFKHLTLPIFAGCWIIGYLWKNDFQKAAGNRFNYWFMFISVPTIFVLLSGGIVLGLNAILPGQEIKIVEGIVTNREMSGGRYKLNLIEITNNNESIRISVREAEYSQIRIGDAIIKELNYGPFGFAYTWRYGLLTKR